MDLSILDGGEGANLQTLDTLPDYNADLETRKEIRKTFTKPSTQNLDKMNVESAVRLARGSSKPKELGILKSIKSGCSLIPHQSYLASLASFTW